MLLMSAISLIKSSLNPWHGSSVFQCLLPLFGSDRTGINRSFVALARRGILLGADSHKDAVRYPAQAIHG